MGRTIIEDGKCMRCHMRLDSEPASAVPTPLENLPRDTVSTDSDNQDESTKIPSQFAEFWTPNPAHPIESGYGGTINVSIFDDTLAEADWAKRLANANVEMAHVEAKRASVNEEN